MTVVESPETAVLNGASVVFPMSRVVPGNPGHLTLTINPGTDVEFTLAEAAKLAAAIAAPGDEYAWITLSLEDADREFGVRLESAEEVAELGVPERRVVTVYRDQYLVLTLGEAAELGAAITKLVDSAHYIAGRLAPEKVRRSALSCIASRTTPEDLRVGAVRACSDLEPVWLAWAAEIELLTGCGVTGRSPREAAKITLALGDRSAADLRQTALEHWQATARGDRLTAVADEMDALLAEGFDPAVYEKEIDQARGAAAEQLLAERGTEAFA